MPGPTTLRLELDPALLISHATGCNALPPEEPAVARLRPEPYTRPFALATDRGILFDSVIAGEPRLIYHTTRPFIEADSVPYFLSTGPDGWVTRSYLIIKP